MKNERTSARVAAIAGAILGAEIIHGGFNILSGKTWRTIRVEDILAMAASLVNQAPDKPMASAQNPKRKLIKRHRSATRNPKGRRR